MFMRACVCEKLFVTLQTFCGIPLPRTSETYRGHIGSASGVLRGNIVSYQTL